MGRELGAGVDLRSPDCSEAPCLHSTILEAPTADGERLVTDQERVRRALLVELGPGGRVAVSADSGVGIVASAWVVPEDSDRATRRALYMSARTRARALMRGLIRESVIRDGLPPDEADRILDQVLPPVREPPEGVEL